MYNNTERAHIRASNHDEYTERKNPNMGGQPICGEIQIFKFKSERDRLLKFKYVKGSVATLIRDDPE